MWVRPHRQRTQTATRAGLGLHGDHNGVVGIAWVKKKDSDVTSADNFNRRDVTGHGDVFKPYRQAALDLDGCGVGGAVECFQYSFYLCVVIPGDCCDSRAVLAITGGEGE